MSNTILNCFCHDVQEAYWSHCIACKRWPKTLIFYRDGVSEGEFAVVADREIDEIRSEFLRSVLIVSTYSELRSTSTFG